MKPEEEVACLKEISANVLDCGKIVTISGLSEDYGISMKESSDILEKWLKENSTTKFSRRYLLHGTMKSGSQFMTIVPEEKLDNWLKKIVKSSKMLYSVRIQSVSRTIEIPKVLNTKQKRLILPANSLNRNNCDVDSTKSVTSHSVSAERESSDSHAAEILPKKTNKNSETESIASMFKNTKPEPKTPTKQLKVSNNKQASPKNKSSVKKSPTKPPKENLPQKGLIASFFNSKPNESAEVPKENGSKREKLKTKDGDVEPTKNRNVNGKHSSITSDDTDDHEIAVTPPPKNPAKKRKIANGKKAPTNRSRIVQMSDSSEDEDENQQQTEEAEQEIPVEPIPDEKKAEIQPAVENKRYRVKKRRLVTETYEDEDGFIKTVKKTEVYSTSEDEVCEVGIKKDEEKRKLSPAKVVKPKAATKQGTIMSFFGKK